MIVFRCLICNLGNLPYEVLTCPKCGVKVFGAQYRPSPEHEPHLQTIAEMMKFSSEPAKPTTEAKFEVAGSSASLIKRTDSTRKDFMQSYEDSAYGIGRPDVECQGSEDADKINFCASNNRLSQDQLSQNVSQDLNVKKRILPETRNAFGHIYGLNAQDNDKFNPSSFNFFPNPACSSNAELQHQIIFSDPLTSTQCQSQSFPEMTTKMHKTTYSSKIQNVDGNMSFACSPHFESPTSMQQSYPESGITKSKLKSNGDQGNNSSPDFLSRLGNSPSRDTLSDDLTSVNKVGHQAAHSSDPRTRMDYSEKVCAFLEKSSSTPMFRKHVKCSKCSINFTSVSALCVHVQSNCDPKPYKCDQCPKKYNCESMLKKHQRVHSKENPFSCDMCKFTTKWEKSLKKHKERWHGKNALYFGHLYNCNDGK